KIDAKGCPLDADGDGVPDGLDTCVDTPKGAQVDAAGCETKASVLEGDMLDTGRMRVLGIAFEPGKSTLMPSAQPALDDVATVLGKWPELKVEIGGHTD